MTNTYSRRWFELFLETRPYTALEVAFIARQLPTGPGHRVLDLCCGQGRLANPLAELGYRVLGVDVDSAALTRARAAAPAGASYRLMDMRQVAALSGAFDAAVCWWQSFGYFDEATNTDVLRQVARKLRPGGRFLLDIYQARYWREHQGERRYQRLGVSILASNRLLGNRLTCELSYDGGPVTDVFEWQVFDLAEIERLAAGVGLNLVLECSECDESQAIGVGSASMQLVFERSG